MHLPPELTDYAIDFLHNDVYSLSSCSLTSRSWLPSARFHLFTSLSISNPHSLAHISHLIVSDPYTAARVIPHIHTLSISKSKKPLENPNNPTSDLFPHSIPWETFLPHSLSPHFPSLTFLRLDGFLSFWQPSTFTLASYAAFNSIQSLSLTCCSVKSFAEFADFLRRLPRLRGLELDGVRFGNGRSAVGGFSTTTNSNYQPTIQPSQSHTHTLPTRLIPSNRIPINTIALSSLSIQRHPKPLYSFLNWFVNETGSGESLRALKLIDLEMADREPVQIFLNRLGDRLERLEIGFKGPANSDRQSLLFIIIPVFLLIFIYLFIYLLTLDI